LTPETSFNTVAIYWDFENLHAALYDRDWGGSRSYGDPRFRYSQQDVLVNIRAVMDFAAGFGDVAINRAYNNWQWFSRYRDALSFAGVDLIQIYPKGARAKNGADIRLALDALEDVFRYPKLTHIIIVSSDSDYISLAQKLKQSGLTVIGVGVQQATNLFWAQNCDEFRDYDTLVGMMGSAGRTQPTRARDDEEGDEPAVKPMSLEEARELTLNALRQLIAQKGAEQVPKSSLKSMMKRMDATFDEASLGFLSFSAFLKTFSDAIEEITDDSGGQVRLRSASEQAQKSSAPTPAAPTASEQNYELILNRGNVRLLPSPWWREAVRIAGEIFKGAPEQMVFSFDDLEGELATQLDAEGLDADPVMVHKLRGFLFALWQFQLDKENHTIRLKASSGGEALLRSVEREIVRRIARFAAPPVDVAKVAAILYGDDAANRLADAQELVDSFANKSA
jgi:uncharacterized LabA/DUF88 family protein